MPASDVHLKKEMADYFDRLFPICRSITGPGYQTSLDILSELLPSKNTIFPPALIVLTGPYQTNG